MSIELEDGEAPTPFESLEERDRPGVVAADNDRSCAAIEYGRNGRSDSHRDCRVHQLRQAADRRNPPAAV